MTRLGFKLGGEPYVPGAVEPDEFEDPNREAPTIGSLIRRGQPIQPRTQRPTPEQIRAARADDRVGGDIVNRRLDTIVPEHTRVAGGTYTPGAPGGGRWADATIAKTRYRLKSGAAKHADPFALRDEGDYAPHTVQQKLIDQPGRGFKVSDQELHNLWQHSVNESSKAAQNAVDKHNVRPSFGGEDWNQAMKLPLRDHLWYELSGEKMAENLPDLTPKEHMKMLDILGATSARAKPDENLERTLGVLSQHLRGAPADVDLTIPSTVTQALGRKGDATSALPGNKTGHFSDTLALAGGVPTRFPISVNDVWVGKMFGVPDDVMSSNQSLHEPMAHYFNKLRDLYNERHGHELPMKYQSWNFQAPAWVHLRNKESGAQQGDAYHQVWPKMIQKLKDAKVPGVEGDKITRQALMHPGFADALRRQAKGFRDAPKATVEFGTTQTPIGKKAHELYQQALEKGDQLSQHEYTKGLTTAMYASARGKNHPWDRLKKAITGDVTGKSDITRIMAPTSEAPLDVGGTFEGALSPNIRVPLKDMDERHLAEFNAIAGRHLKQDAMAVSHVLGADHGSEPRPGYTRGHSLFVPTTDQINPNHIRDFARDLAPHGHNMSYVRHPNGYQFDILPAFGDEGPKGVDKHLLDEAYGNTLRHTYGPANVTAHDFKSVYTEASDYGKTRAALTKRMRDEYVQQAARHGITRPQALKALEAPERDLPRGGKEARDVYRQRVAHLAGAEQGFKELAQRVGEAHKGFIERASKRLAKPAPPRDPDAPPFASGGGVNHAPTDAQKEAGNYAKECISFQGLPVSIENKRGSIRSGTDAKGKRWEARLPADYGYVRGTEGADGDHVDCFVGPDKNSPLVVVVDQHDHRSKQFDEHKLILGTRSEREAIKLYCDAFSDGRGVDRIGHIQSMSIDALKHWLKNGRTKRPAKNAAIVEQALGLARMQHA